MIQPKSLQPVLLNHQNGPYIKNVRVNYFMPWGANRVLASTFNGIYVLDKNARIIEHYGSGRDATISLPYLRIYHTA